MFDAGELRLVLLLLLEAQPRHGYDFIREIEDRTGGTYAPSPGVVYPTLAMLEDLGHIEETHAEGPKRLYALTAAGRTQLEEHRAEAESAMARLVALGTESSQIETGPIWRAMQNLKTVLQQQLGAKKDKQAMLDVAEIIDEAARKIERL